MVKFPKGAVWRKWDVHVHTPASALNNGFGTDWDIYVQTLFKKAIEKDISAIGITDYFLIEGYKTLKKNYLDNEQKLAKLFTDEEIESIKNIYVFPNIEFRLTKLIIGKEKDLTWNRKLNFHVLLSNLIDPEYIESDFISQLRFDYTGNIGTDHEKRSLTKTNLIDLGNKLIQEHTPFQGQSPLYVGMVNASVDEGKIAEILAQHSKFKDQYLLGLPSDEDLSLINWNSQSHNIRKNLIKQSQFIFSANPKTIKFHLGTDDKEVFKKEFGQVRACLWGSDAHNTNDLFEPADHRYTWIKADLTFEGLKQVIYDPESRVKIQQSNPQKKSLYQIIDKVRFVDNRKKPEFSNEWIEINPDLNTIIGGKSSGKSLLLCHMAKAINYQEATTKIRIAKASTYSEFENNIDLNFEVKWANGGTSSLRQKNESKPISYIPQLYINQLAEESGKEQLNSLIESILIQNQGYKEFVETKDNEISDLNQSISNNISTLILLDENSKKLKEEFDSIGIKDSVNDEIKKLSNYSDTLREQSGFTTSEESDYQKLQRRLNSLQNRLSFLKNLKSYIEQIVGSAKRKSSYASSNFVRTISAEYQFPKESIFVNRLFTTIELKLNMAISEFESETNSKTMRIDRLLVNIECKIEPVKLKISPLLSKIQEQALLLETQEKIDIEKEKIKKLDDLENKLDTSQAQINEVLKVIVSQYKNLTEIYLSFGVELNKPDFQVGDDLSISSKVSFNEKKFDIFFDSFDRRGSLFELASGLVDLSGNYNFEVSSHHETLEKILSKLVANDKLPVRKTGVSYEELFRRLFADCFYIDYVVSYMGDEIFVMSPGKRGLVLLSLVLHISNSTHPILIDQPEDNLDNRTIYEQLNNFIRQKKFKRQIIMVTHNANLVVSADAESIIVANQSGQFAGMENKKFRFEYISGSIENSFDDKKMKGILYQKGIREHICEILEGGINAFQERETKYGLRH